MSPVTHIRRDDAQRIHAQLVAALGTETNPAQWMLFMRTVREHLPDVLSRGRPTRAAIEKSAIGALGFASWREMCETSTDRRGLGLPWSQWRQWSRAWAVVQSHPGLEGEPLTAAQVNKLAADAQAADEPVPDTQAEIQAFQERQAERRAAARESTQAGLREQVAALEVALEASDNAGRSEFEAACELRDRLDAALSDQYQTARQHYQMERDLRDRLDRAEAARAAAEQAQFAAQAERQAALLDLRALQERFETAQQDAVERFDQQDRELEQLRRYRNRGFWSRLLGLFSGT